MRILYIDCDSLRRDHLGCYGYHRDTSPNIDALAADGLRCTNVYASDAPCLPSRTALFLDRFGIHTGVINHGGLNADPRPHGELRQFSYPSKFRTWPSTLVEAGIHTASVSPFASRHDAYQVLEGIVEFHDPRDSHQHAADMYPYAADWLRENASDDDWFLHVNFWDPHTEYNTPMEYGNPFESEPAPEWLSQEIIDDHRAGYSMNGAKTPPSWDVPRMPDEIRDPSDFKTLVDGYDVGIHFMDHHIGKLCDLLRDAGVFEDTLIIVSADHGEQLGEFNVYGDHQLADEYTCGVPLIMDGPQVTDGVDDTLHYQLDLPPTINELLDARVPAGWDGTAFTSTVVEGAEDGREHLVLSQGAWACQRAVRWDKWLYLRTYHDGVKSMVDDEMLFDLSDDRHETTNLAGERPDIVERARAKHQAWYEQRMLESSRGQRGGNPQTPNGVVDPMWQTLHEGGPYHARIRIEDYAGTLRDRGFEELADTIIDRYT